MFNKPSFSLPQLGLLLLCAAWLLPGLIGHGPWKGGDGSHFVQLWQMLQSGGTPQATLDTPPVYFWVASATAWLTSPFLDLPDGARLASGLFVALALFFIAPAARVLYGEEAGWAAAVMILCAVVKLLHKKPKVFRYAEMHCRAFHEKRLVEALVDEMQKYHLWIGHNVNKFDFPFMKSRANLLGVPFQCAPLSYDTMLAFRRIGYLTARNPITGKPRANLDHVVDFFNIPQLKTKVGYPNAHWRTVWGDAKQKGEAMDTLVDHCIYDCTMTEEVYWKELPVDPVWGLRRLR